MNWRTLPPLLRRVAWWVTVVQVVGYTTSLLFVWHTTRLTPGGVADRYRGAGDFADTAQVAVAMQFPKSFGEMLTITHTHLLSMVVIFAISGVALALCTRPSERWKRFLVIEPFVALLVSFSAMWLMRYVDGRFAWLLEVSSAILAATFYIQSYLVLRELAYLGREAP